MTENKISNSDKIQKLEQEIEQLKKVTNPMLEQSNPSSDTNNFNLSKTLDKAHDVITYLMINARHDVDTFVAPDAREWITECALNAIEFVVDNMDAQEVEL